MRYGESFARNCVTSRATAALDWRLSRISRLAPGWMLEALRHRSRGWRRDAPPPASCGPTNVGYRCWSRRTDKLPSSSPIPPCRSPCSNRRTSSPNRSGCASAPDAMQSAAHSLVPGGRSLPAAKSKYTSRSCATGGACASTRSKNSAKFPGSSSRLRSVRYSQRTGPMSGVAMGVNRYAARVDRENAIAPADRVAHPE